MYSKIEKTFTFQWWFNKFFINKQMAQVCHLLKNKQMHSIDLDIIKKLYLISD
jgi:hypothetical protein